MGLEDLKDFYRDETPESAKRQLDLYLRQISAFVKDFRKDKDEFVTYTINCSLLFQVCEEKGLLEEKILEEYKIRYFDCINKIAEDMVKNEKK